jgi:hypothetical protein
VAKAVEAVAVDINHQLRTEEAVAPDRPRRPCEPAKKLFAASAINGSNIEPTNVSSTRIRMEPPVEVATKATAEAEGALVETAPMPTRLELMDHQSPSSRFSTTKSRRETRSQDFRGLRRSWRMQC